jgi:hypothetical protein
VTAPQHSKILTVDDLAVDTLKKVLQRYRLQLVIVADGVPVPASYWGAPEAGISGNTIYARGDTPIHSILHESSHVICMTGQRRADLHRDAGGDDLEESAVCYLQLLLADHIDGVGRQRLMQDMDDWGYSFRLGSTSAWFERDAEDARQFLINHGLIRELGDVSFAMRA